MPSQISREGGFLSLKPDDTCGRETNGSTNGSAINGHGDSSTNGDSKSYLAPNADEFLRLAPPQQDLLVLHGPRQRYSLEKDQELPQIKDEREILIQVLAIGLNPVDWKGPDNDFGQPAYPWVNGRDFAGIVVKGAQSPSSRIKAGDIVFGPSTDYRDIRKAAYQEYLVTTDFNVARIPGGVSVKDGAALGVAYAAASIALGISFGLDFTRIQEGPAGPDLFSLVRGVNQKDNPEDVRAECFESLGQNERAKAGDWITIWGGSTTTAFIAVQLAKAAGLRVVCVADVARNGNNLVEMGADVLVDRMDLGRAKAIIKSVTGGKLRFAIDIGGKESAELLQEILDQNTSGQKGHLLGFSGLPKEKSGNVVQHNVPIKVFHTAPVIGEVLVTWLEDMLLQKKLQLPQVEIADGGLAGINAALDRLRNGEVRGKRLVVPVGAQNRAASPQARESVPSTVGEPTTDLSYADSLNGDADRVKFAYWVPNVSGGLVISKIPQRTYWDLKSNERYARTAEQVGFEYALSQIRFMAGYGAENQHEPVSFSQALLAATNRLKVIAALLPGPWNPAVAAKQIASIDHYCNGRICINVVSGWFKTEFTSIGQWWLDHAERYRRSREFIACMKGIWTNKQFTFKGDFYQFHDYPLMPKPLVLPDRPYPEIFQGGNSNDARDNAATVSDYYFMNGNTLEGFQSQITDVKERAYKAGRGGQVKFALNAFVICRETEEEAVRVLGEIQGQANAEAVLAFRDEVQNAGASTANKTGMWANSKFEDLVQYNDGFKTKLIGTKYQIAERICLLKSLGVSIILTAFLHYEEEIRQFGEEVIPLVRKMEKEGRGSNADFEIQETGDVYKARVTGEKTQK